ncbi:MAG TPA: hypothetical protein VFK05_19050 [Polyangiaceae bacterium]|nr:hypothetical protein [Polyangiaceae bacterium]
MSFDQHALLLIGESGAGKSTTATALVRAGCGYLGDDGVLIRQRPGDVELLPLWSSFRLTDQSLGSFETLRSHSSKLAGEEKWTLNARAAFPDRFLSHWLGRKALLFLGRSGKADSFVQPVAQAEALGLLIAQSRSFSFECDPGARRHLDLLAQLVRVAHSARLQLGTEWLVDPDGSAQRLLERAQSLFRAPDARDDVS